LRGDESLIGLEILQQRLSDSLDGRPQRARAFTPHMTLLRDAHRVPDHDIEPIEWQVQDVVLVHSLLGKTTHRHLARVPLAN
jgi:RNA 2',3'-cyclic 3'-phosphodiesterase